jgi:hypothetical protein
LKEEALDRTVSRSRFGRGYRHVVRVNELILGLPQTTTTHFKTLTRIVPPTERFVQLQCARIYLVRISTKKLAVVGAGVS